MSITSEPWEEPAVAAVDPTVSSTDRRNEVADDVGKPGGTAGFPSRHREVTGARTK
ncbi:MAG: hypothetical protein KDB69_01720 [Acidimicrobiia bacterium]|nr:hypothetical protein [Acidimicrobiia bacterium]